MATRFDPSQLSGIAPAPKPPIMTPPIQSAPVNTKFPLNPGMGGPIQGQMNPAPTGAPAANYNPAARDVALRNLATQTPAAPTATQMPAASAPTSATPATPATPPAPGADGGSMGAPQHPPGATPQPNASDLGQLLQGHMGDVQSFMQQLRATTDPGQRQQLVDNMKAQVQTWLAGLHTAIDNAHHSFAGQMNDFQQRAAPEPFAHHWDALEAQDQAAAQPTATDTTQGQEDANATADAQRIKRARKSRLGGGSAVTGGIGNVSGAAGIYTGTGG